MKYALFIFIIVFTSLASASDWPPELIAKTYDGCIKKGGASQCDCLVTRLRTRFSFEDIILTRQRKIAFEALKQAVEMYNVKCLDADFKKETLHIKQQLLQKKF